MNNFVLSPPVVFIILILVGLLLSYSLSFIAPSGAKSQRKAEAYACGQRNIDHRVSPDYSQFFPVAFFFTIMHVMVLTIATAPKDALTLPLIYIGAALLALLIIFRR